MPVSRYCTTILDSSAINYLRFEILPINQRSIYLLNDLLLYVFMIFLFLHKNRITYLNKYREKYKYEYKLYEIK